VSFSSFKNPINFLAEFIFPSYLSRKTPKMAMDYSKYLQLKAQGQQVYRSNWQGRDASEVTMRNHQMASQKTSASAVNDNNQHHGPANECCPKPGRPTSPSRGFSTDYTQTRLINKPAGCANCQDPNFGAPGGVVIVGCAEAIAISQVPDNPVKGSGTCCADPGVKQRGVVDCSKVAPAYTGWRNQVPTDNKGVLPLQYPPYPSG
jgi:hypothetical protein